EPHPADPGGLVGLRCDDDLRRCLMTGGVEGPLGTSLRCGWHCGLLSQGVVSVSSAEKNLRAVAVLVCCSPVRSTPRSARNAFVLAATSTASSGAHLVESSRMREPSG